jgi:uncharacterized membrane protein (TIGR02234 family)
MAEADPGRRRTFGPVALLGLAAGTLAVVAGHGDWVRFHGSSQGEGSVLTLTGQGDAGAPLAGALALVLLACWGVVLVTRGRVRRGVTALGLVTALGMAVTAVLGYRSAADGLRDQLAQAGVSHPSVGPAPWYWAYVVGAVLSVAAAAAAVRNVPSWPEMGSRYDAPGSAPAPVDQKTVDQTPVDLWRALDEGRDPTLPETRPVDP